MKRLFSKIKDTMTGPSYEEESTEGGYVELDSDSEDVKSKILVRPFTITDFEDIKPILDSLREGYTIALINIRPLKDKDLVELFISHRLWEKKPGETAEFPDE